MSYSLAGIIMDKNKHPIEDATVLITYSEASVHDIAAITNEKGEFALHDLAKGKTIIKIITYDKEFLKEVILEEDSTNIVIIEE